MNPKEYMSTSGIGPTPRFKEAPLELPVEIRSEQAPMKFPKRLTPKKHHWNSPNAWSEEAPLEFLYM